MASYSIKDLERITSIKAHTIRIWERRYELIDPKRTLTNIRLYSDEELKLLLNISILSQNGFKISKIASLSKNEISDRVLDICVDKSNSHIHIESLIVSMLELNDHKFSEIIANSVTKNGFEYTVEQILFQFLERIGTLWQAGAINAAQEHFISNLIRQKLIVAIDNEMLKSKTNGDTILFFLPEGDFHELGLLFYSYIARKEGFNVLYLGSSVPYADLKQVVEIRTPKIVFTSLVNPISNIKLKEFISNTSHIFQSIPIFINGRQIKDQKPKLPSNFKTITSADVFRKHLLASKQSN